MRSKGEIFGSFCKQITVLYNARSSAVTLSKNQIDILNSNIQTSHIIYHCTFAIQSVYFRITEESEFNHTSALFTASFATLILHPPASRCKNNKLEDRNNLSFPPVKFSVDFYKFAKILYFILESWIKEPILVMNCLSLMLHICSSRNGYNIS